MQWGSSLFWEVRLFGRRGVKLIAADKYQQGEKERKRAHLHNLRNYIPTFWEMGTGGEFPFA
jgi:hypothetical protein